jgi:hypothetical protein
MRGGFPMVNPKVQAPPLWDSGSQKLFLGPTAYSHANYLVEFRDRKYVLGPRQYSQAPESRVQVRPADRSMDHSRLFGTNLPPGASTACASRAPPHPSNTVHAGHPHELGNPGEANDLPSPVRPGSAASPGLSPLPGEGGGYGAGPVARDQSWPPPPVARLGALPPRPGSPAEVCCQSAASL